MRIGATIAAFFVGMFLVGAMRMAGFGGALAGLVQVFLFFGLPWLTWKALAPQDDEQKK